MMMMLMLSVLNLNKSSAQFQIPKQWLFDKYLSRLHFQSEATLTNSSTLIQFWELAVEKGEARLKLAHIYKKKKRTKRLKMLLYINVSFRK